MESQGKVWFPAESVYVKVLSRGVEACKVTWVEDPGIQMIEWILYEDLVFEEEDDDGL